MAETVAFRIAPGYEDSAARYVLATTYDGFVTVDTFGEPSIVRDAAGEVIYYPNPHTVADAQSWVAAQNDFYERTLTDSFRKVFGRN